MPPTCPYHSIKISIYLPFTTSQKLTYEWTVVAKKDQPASHSNPFLSHTQEVQGYPTPNPPHLSGILLKNNLEQEHLKARPCHQLL